MKKISNKKILITGGTGSFGKAFVSKILSLAPDIERLVIYSRDELKQSEMSKEFPTDKYGGIRYFLGDVRDADRLNTALEGIDTVIHAAALKQVPAAEYNPFEFIKTNIIGAQNIIQSCMQNDVENVIALSTDKACSPINLYGATKLCSDKLFVSANYWRGKKNKSFSVVRYGNVMGSRGSVIPLFLENRNKNSLPITHNEMTRFNITLEDGVKMVLWALENSIGSEIFVPKIPSYKILDLAKAINPNAAIKIIGVRPGEKIHEEMISSSDSAFTFDLGEYYAVLQSGYDEKINYYSKKGFKKVREGFSYNSGTNDQFLNVNEIKELIKLNIDNNFE